jgi:hypothetical protein
MGLGAVAAKLPYLATTSGGTGFAIHPKDWERGTATSNNILGLPTGTSSLTHLFGNAGYPWKKSLPPIPTAEHAGSFLTVTSHSKYTSDNLLANSDKRSSVTTKLKNLEPGKLYQFTVYGASTICKVAQNGYEPGYATMLVLKVYPSKNYNGSAYNTLPLLGLQAGWWPREIMFKAEGTEATLEFSAYTDSDDRFTYGHLFVDENSIKKLN